MQLRLRRDVWPDLTEGGLRIVMVGPYPQDPLRIAGGVEASVYGIVHGLIAAPDIKTIDVVSLPVKGVSRQSTEGVVEGDRRLRITFLSIPGRLQVSTLRHLPYILGLSLRDRATVTHVHGSGPLQTGVLIALRFMRSPAVWTMHGVTALETQNIFYANGSARNLARWLLYATVERLALWNAKHIVVDTPYVAEAVGTRRVVVIPQGVADDVVEEDSGDKSANDIIVSIGVLKPRKGHHLLIEAFRHVREAVPTARLRIIGATADPAYGAHLQQLVKDAGLVGVVSIESGLQRPEVVAALRECAIFALHTQEESQCIAVCEAMATGKPIVATSVGALKYIVPPEAGVLVRYGDASTFGEALIDLLNDTEKRKRMGQAGRSESLKYHWPALARRVISVYEAAVASAQSPGTHADQPPR